MLDNKIDELFTTIEDSKEYKEYKKLGSILEKDPNITLSLNEIKELQKEATYLEENGDERYKQVDELIASKVKVLESNEIYKEYLSKMKEFNKIIATSSNIIEGYLNNNI